MDNNNFPDNGNNQESQPMQNNLESQPVQSNLESQPMQNNLESQPMQSNLGDSQLPQQHEPIQGELPDMENQPFNGNQTPPPPPTEQPAYYNSSVEPDNSAFTFGLLGIIFSVCCGCLPVGVILGIIALTKAKSGIKAGDPNPKLHTAKVLGIIAIILGALAIVSLIISGVTGALGVAIDEAMNY